MLYFARRQTMLSKWASCLAREYSFTGFQTSLTPSLQVYDISHSDDGKSPSPTYSAQSRSFGRHLNARQRRKYQRFATVPALCFPNPSASERTVARFTGHLEVCKTRMRVFISASSAAAAPSIKSCGFGGSLEIDPLRLDQLAWNALNVFLRQFAVSPEVQVDAEFS